MLDLIVKDGLLFDGLGSPPVRRDLGIADGRVRRIAREISEPARETIDARGLWVVPGFIDIHTHYDIELEIAPGLSESTRHGVTAVVMGNCSLSLTLGDPADLADIFLRVENIPRVLVRKWMTKSVTWKSPRDYFRHLESLELGPSVGAMLGHSALRAAAMGLERSLKETAGEADLARMKELAREAFDAGCLGLSCDMVPWHMMDGRFKGRTIPSQHADFREVRELAALCAERGLVLQVSPNPQDLSSVVKILWLALSLPLKITVLAALDPAGMPWAYRLFKPALFFLNKVLGCDIRCQTLTEPFQVFSDGPLTPLFEEFPAGRELNDLDSREERQALWRTPGFRDRFKEQWLHGKRRTFHRRLDLMTVVRAPDPALSGRTFKDIDEFMDLLARFDTDLRWESTGANGRLKPRLALLSDDGIFPGFTDAGAHVRNLGYYDGALSLLKQAVQTGFMTPQAALRRVTSEPARWFGLDAGVLREGKRADFVLLDPEGLQSPISEQVEIADPLLDGAVRMVKRGSEQCVREVFLAGCGAVLRPVLSLREPISDAIGEHPFTDYWDIFVLKHQNPFNVALHCLGVVWFYGFLAAAWRNPWFLAALPGSQLIGLLGHYFFERSHIDRRDAVFSWRASRCLNKMFARVLVGAYGRDIRERLEKLSRKEISKTEPVAA